MFLIITLLSENNNMWYTKNNSACSDKYKTEFIYCDNTYSLIQFVRHSA